MRRIRVPALPTAEPVNLEPAQAHHLRDVLRRTLGDRVVAFDGMGQQVEAEVVAVSSAGVALVAVGEPTAAAPPHPLHLVLGIPKAKALDQALRMATEAGATHLHPAVAARSTPRGDKAARWRTLTAEAARQCGRADLPEVAPLRPLAKALAAVPDDHDRRIALPAAPELPPATGPAAVAIGPEGGFTEAEVRAALHAGWNPMGLGRWVLRADTAAAVALAATAPR